MKIAWGRKPIRRLGQRGNAIIEASLLAPWMLFLMVGVLDLGFYTPMRRSPPKMRPA